MVSHSFTSSPAGIFCHFDSKPSNKYEVMAPCASDFISLVINVIYQFFMYLLAIRMTSLDKCIFKSLKPKQFHSDDLSSSFSIKKNLSILFLVNPMLDRCFDNVFSHLMDFGFILLTVFLSVQKLYSLV